MTVWAKIRFRFKSKKTLREQTEAAYGLWLVTPRMVSAPTFISNMTGIPKEKVRGILLGNEDYYA